MSWKRTGLLLLIVFYFVAGVNHFVMPGFYGPLIPDYFPAKNALNTISGIAEILLAGGLAIQKTRSIAAFGIIVLLVAFIPAHVHFIQAGACFEGSLCVPLWVAWVRLFPIHLLLMLWAWWCRDAVAFYEK
ncbi:MAG: hypothetical protein AAFZ15_12455 [Bacteroidota bacterium]